MRRKEIESLLETMDQLIVALDKHYNGDKATTKLHTDDYGQWARIWEE